jgi:hypothetical protein
MFNKLKGWEANQYSSGGWYTLQDGTMSCHVSTVTGCCGGVLISCLDLTNLATDLDECDWLMSRMHSVLTDVSMWTDVANSWDDDEVSGLDSPMRSLGSILRRSKLIMMDAVGGESPFGCYRMAEQNGWLMGDDKKCRNTNSGNNICIMEWNNTDGNGEDVDSSFHEHNLNLG